METVVNKEVKKWIRPWNVEKFDNVSNQDNRFISLVTKGLLGYLTKTIKMYNKNILHYILSTGTEYLYVEANDYEFSWNTTNGESTLYSHLPRCTVDMEDISIQKEELTSPFSRGYYERIVDDELKTFSAEMRRIPLQINYQLHYSLSNFNEALILIEELINNLIWQKYFNINYLGQQIQCSIEVPDSWKITYNKVDFSVESKNKTIDIQVILRTTYPQINEKTEIDASKIISVGILNTNPHREEYFNKLDEDNTQRIIQ